MKIRRIILHFGAIAGAIVAILSLRGVIFAQVSALPDFLYSGLGFDKRYVQRSQQLATNMEGNTVCVMRFGSIQMCSGSVMTMTDEQHPNTRKFTIRFPVEFTTVPSVTFAAIPRISTSTAVAWGPYRTEVTLNQATGHIIALSPIGSNVAADPYSKAVVDLQYVAVGQCRDPQK